MKVLLLGPNGQVGWELQRSLAPLGEVISLGREGRDGLCGDLTRLDALAETVRAVRPGVIVNAAAYTAVDEAESEPDTAHTANAEGPGVLAREAAQSGAWLVHYSTDYVFDGSGERPWNETDSTGPLNVYGKTKLEGEQAIKASGCKHLVFRTSWVYSARGNNFARIMLRLARERERLSVIDDQVGAPTGAGLIADISAHALRSALTNQDVSGLYHLAAGGEVSWHGYASFVIDQARAAGLDLAVQSIETIPTTDYPLPAPRPLNSRLDCRKLHDTFGLNLPPWQAGVSRMLKETQGFQYES